MDNQQLKEGIATLAKWIIDHAVRTESGGYYDDYYLCVDCYTSRPVNYEPHGYGMALPPPADFPHSKNCGVLIAKRWLAEVEKEG